MTDTTEEPTEQEVSEPQEREVRLDPSQAIDWGDVSIAGHPKEEPQEVEEPEVEEVIDESDDEEDIPFIPTSLPDDPGEYTPSDYSFEIEVEGKKTKISTPEEAETFMDENADNFTAPELLKIIRQTSKMESKLESDRADYEKRKEDFESKQAQVNEQQQTTSNISAEISYMVSKGMIPAITDKAAATRWATDPSAYLDKEFLKTPGIKEQVDLITALEKENKVRVEAGLQPTKSVLDVYNSLQLSDKTQEELDQRQRQAKARKDASSRVAGSSPNPTSIAPKGIAVGRTLALSDLDSF